jgi:hypothetical protein
MPADPTPSRRFEVALSFPGEHRDFVAAVAATLVSTFIRAYRHGDFSTLTLTGPPNLLQRAGIKTAGKRFSDSTGSLTIPGGESMRICSIDPRLSFPCRSSLLAFPQPMSACHPFSLHAGIAGNTGYRNPRLQEAQPDSAPP